MGLEACWQQEEQAAWEMLGEDIFSIWLGAKDREREEWLT